MAGGDEKSGPKEKLLSLGFGCVILQDEGGGDEQGWVRERAGGLWAEQAARGRQEAWPQHRWTGRR